MKKKLLGTLFLISSSTALAIIMPCPIGEVTPPVRVRGVVDSISSVKNPTIFTSMNSKTSIIVNSRRKFTSMLLDSDSKFLFLQLTSVEQLSLNSKVLIVGSIQADQSMQASAVGVLPQEVAVGGERLWDTGAKSTLIDGRIIAIEVKDTGLLMVVRLNGKVLRHVLVTAETPVTSIQLLGPDSLRRGQAIVMEGSKYPDCKLHANLLFVGFDRLIPPF